MDYIIWIKYIHWSKKLTYIKKLIIRALCKYINIRKLLIIIIVDIIKQKNQKEILDN